MEPRRMGVGYLLTAYSRENPPVERVFLVAPLHAPSTTKQLKHTTVFSSLLLVSFYQNLSLLRAGTMFITSMDPGPCINQVTKQVILLWRNWGQRGGWIGNSETIVLTCVYMGTRIPLPRFAQAHTKGLPQRKKIKAQSEPLDWWWWMHLIVKMWMFQQS